MPSITLIASEGAIDKTIKDDALKRGSKVNSQQGRSSKPSTVETESKKVHSYVGARYNAGGSGY